MNLHEIVTRATKLVADNSPAILTAIGVTGTLTTAYLASKASFKAAETLHQETEYRYRLKKPPMEMKEMIKYTWKLYIPAELTGIFTIAAIIGANRIGTRRAAAMAAAYTVSEKAYSEYKEKVIQRIGDSKERALRDEIAQDRVSRNPVSGRDIIITGNGDVLCYDAPTGRYFESNMESLRKAMNDINYMINKDAHSYASLSEFYILLNLVTTPYSEEVGWTIEQPLELDFSATLSDDNRPCISIDYKVVHIRGYNQLHSSDPICLGD